MIKNNNFNFLRFLFAILVVVSHSYPLSGSNESEQWIHQITNGQLNWASIGLNGFFVISGYFIFQSLQRSTSLLDYFKKRILRIFPALVGMLLLVLLVVPFLYTGDGNIFVQYDYYSYLPNNLSLYLFQSTINGVFDSNYYHAINGSLWTIRYEFSLYIALAILYFFRNSKEAVANILFISLVLMYLIFVFFINQVAGYKIANLQGYHLFNLGTFFVAGSVMASLEFEKYINKTILFVGLVVTVIAIYFQCYDLVKHILLPIIVLTIGFIPFPFFSSFDKYGDMSYGIYIYSFSVQQTLVYLFNLKVYMLMLVSLFISISLGYFSWHLIEKRALQFKNGYESTIFFKINK